jgi:hypothetical protein
MAQGSAKKQHLTVDRLSDVYLFGGTVYFTSSGTFDKGDYPGLRAVRVKVQGGGGGGGGATAGSGESQWSGGGTGGTYGEALIPASDLSASVAVTVGGGGAGGVGNSAGSSGDASSFGSHVSAPGGLNGASGSAPGTSFITNSSRVPPGGATGTADGILSVPGGTTSGHFRASATQGLSSAGGSSVLGVGGRALGADDDGEPGEGYGGGGSGAAARGGSGDQTGGAGSDGIVIVELYY